MKFDYKEFDVVVKEKKDNLEVFVQIKGPKNLDPMAEYAVSFVAAMPAKYNHVNGCSKSIPFLNRENAYENTKNKGKFIVEEQKFSFELKRPGCYYTEDHTVLVPPYFSLSIKVGDKLIKKEIVLGCRFEEKKLTPNTTLYKQTYNKTQEDILLEKSL
jgi:hypothetical protein